MGTPVNAASAATVGNKPWNASTRTNMHKNSSSSVTPSGAFNANRRTKNTTSNEPRSSSANKRVLSGLNYPGQTKRVGNMFQQYERR